MLKLTFARSHKKAFGVSTIVFLFSPLFVMPALSQQPSDVRAYLGFDLNDYPGAVALPILRKSFSFAGYWLCPPPGAKTNSWLGKRVLLRSLCFGFMVISLCQQRSELQQKWPEVSLLKHLINR